ncbi:MAG: VPLPA-CTERM sorting domain-containing protein [Pseudomonadota bacterium]
MIATKFLTACAFAVAVFGAASTASAATLPVFGTGFLTDSTTQVGDGALDGNWSVTSSPLGAFTPIAITPDGFPIPPWVANDANSRWIGPATDGDGSAPSGTYTYSQTFEIAPGADTSLAFLEGQFAADDSANMFLNGNLVASTTGGFSAFTDYSITDFFIIGVNTLTVEVVNAGGSSQNPTGLRLSVLESFDGVTAVPLPAGILMLLGALGITGVSCRKRAAA